MGSVICKNCEKQFEGKRSTARFCSDICRVNWSKKFKAPTDVVLKNPDGIPPLDRSLQEILKENEQLKKQIMELQIKLKILEDKLQNRSASPLPLPPGTGPYIPNGKKVFMNDAIKKKLGI